MTARPGLARRKGAAQRGKKNERRKLKAKTFNNVSKDTFLRLFVLGRQKLLFTLHLQFWVPACLCSTAEGNKDTAHHPLPFSLPLSPSPACCPSEPNYYFHEFKLWFALRTFLAFPLLWWPPPLDVNYVYARLVLRPLDRAPSPPQLPMQPHLFLCVQSLWSSGFSLGSPGQALWSS